MRGAGGASYGGANYDDGVGGELRPRVRGGAGTGDDGGTPGVLGSVDSVAALRENFPG